MCANLQLSLTFGVLSLSEVHDSLLMWSHYGEQHKGFVIEFDTEGEFFQTCLAEAYPSFLMKVEYSDIRPHLSSTTLGRPEALSRKSRAWSYEREWRLIRYLVRADQIISLADGQILPKHDALPIHLFEFPAKSVTAVFTGARMRAEEYQSLVRLVTNDPDYSHVRLHHMRQSEEEFMLVTDPPLPGLEDPEAVNGRVVSARPFRV